MFLGLLFFTLTSSAAAAGTAGITTRYWDCCKPACSWPGKAPVSSPVRFCDAQDSPVTDFNAPSACDAGGNGYSCSDQSPWAVSPSVAYGFAAVALSGVDQSQSCCQCYQLNLTGASASGKTMIVQAVNTGDDVAGDQFDLLIPGGGVGQYDACGKQWGAPPGGWGAQYGGVSSSSDCTKLPKELQVGCHFRFDWMKGANNPQITYHPVTCPKAITAKSGCERT